VYKILKGDAQKRLIWIWDGMSANVIKRIAQEIVTPLSNLINTSFVEGKFPENMKRSDM
jgi:hypothetical protein